MSSGFAGHLVRDLLLQPVFALEHVLQPGKAAVRVSGLDPLHRGQDDLPALRADVLAGLAGVRVLLRGEPPVAVGQPAAVGLGTRSRPGPFGKLLLVFLPLSPQPGSASAHASRASASSASGASASRSSLSASCALVPPSLRASVPCRRLLVRARSRQRPSAPRRPAPAVAVRECSRVLRLRVRSGLDPRHVIRVIDRVPVQAVGGGPLLGGGEHRVGPERRRLARRRSPASRPRGHVSRSRRPRAGSGQRGPHRRPRPRPGRSPSATTHRITGSHPGKRIWPTLGSPPGPAVTAGSGPRDRRGIGS